mgnify:FL=1
MKPITPQQIASLSTAQQYFHDCYLLSSLGILSRSKKGQKILQNNITTNGKDFNIKFLNVNGKTEDYFISESEINNLEYIDSKPIFSNPSIPIVKSIELAMNKLIKKHPFQKPLICRALETQERFEYNKPSNFLKLFTGITPETINESNLSMSLLDKISKAIDTLKKIANDKDSTFIAGTGISFEGLPSWHCYGITKVDIQNNKFYVFDHRLNKELEFPIISGLLKFKFLTGFWSKDLK